MATGGMAVKTGHSCCVCICGPKLGYALLASCVIFGSLIGVCQVEA